MDRRMRAAGCVFIFMAVLLIASCGSGVGPELKGRWVEVNGDARLVIGNRTLEISYGSLKKTYPYKLEKEGTLAYLVGTGPEGFGLLGDIEVCRDGSLSAYEQILDGPSTEYRFVREENLAAELEIRDLSKDLPKEIVSDEIESFSLTFENQPGYGLGDEWPDGYYNWSVEGADDQYDMHFEIMGDSYVVMQFDEEVSGDYVRGLAQTIRKLGIPEQNGYYKKNNTRLSGYYLYCVYTSGEKLDIKAEGDAAGECVFDLGGLLEYAKGKVGDKPEEG